MLKHLKITGFVLAGCLFFIGCGGGDDTTVEPESVEITIPTESSDAPPTPTEGE
ncbi:MAG: hypothetical protein ACKVH8_04435 [Pirellulales bacterium]|jgi:ABC-type glycerol-3-phosphate transport system substrate-binding protein